MPIQVLPKEIAEKIAAGEVIERPASVIKELVENAIDANASHIRIEIEDAGKKLIRVTDNGCGIPYDEVLLAFKHHATSKIQKIDDLWNLKTMGFRGEALPSIAAISRLTMITKSFNFKPRKVYMEANQVLKDETLLDFEFLNSIYELGATGTSIIVEDLFYNVPARLKFQRSKTNETSFIREMIESFALSNPKINFYFFSEARKSFEAITLNTLSDEEKELARVSSIFGVALDDIEVFSTQTDEIKVIGYLDRNTRAKNTKQIYLSVNQRIVKDKLLQQAVISALRPRMMEGEYPKIFLKLILPPQEVDVNVHPTKSEVRFQKSKDVYQLIFGVLNKLAQTNSKPYYSVSMNTTKPFIQSLFSGTSEENKFNFKTKENFFISTKNLDTNDNSLTSATSSDSTSSFDKENENLLTNQLSQNKNNLFSSLHYIGQLHNTYLLFQESDGLVIIDQHAAHERINYEKIKNQFLNEGIKAQPLLISMTIKCKPEEVIIATENHDLFQKFGFEIEVFGNDCLLLRTIPSFLSQSQAKDLFLSLLEELKDIDDPKVLLENFDHISKKLERLLSTTACHASIRAGQTLSKEEAIALLIEMETTPSSLNCPHGRPASIKLNLSQIEGLFKR
jgi:DNA mismatch repair protein MutL